MEYLALLAVAANTAQEYGNRAKASINDGIGLIETLISYHILPCLGLMKGSHRPLKATSYLFESIEHSFTRSNKPEIAG